MSDLLSVALDYASRGWRVFPCHGWRDGRCSCGNTECSGPGKRPYTSNGFKEATTDADQIRRWWKQWPDANIGVATGAASGLLVLDLDGPDAVGALSKMEERQGPLPLTPETRTGKGQHRLFRYPSGVTIKNRTKLGGFPIDVRADGGYFIAPPSKHKSGNVYQWVHSPDVTPIADAPQWLIGFMTDRGNAAVVPTTTDFSDPLTDEILDLRTAPGVSQGGRHDMALRLVGAELNRGTDLGEIFQLGIAWAERCNPPMDLKEMARIITDLDKNDTQKIEAAVSRKSDTSRPVMGDDAFYGLAGEIVRKIEPETEADPVAVLIQLLTMFGNEVGRGPHALVGATRHYPNLYTVIAGDSSKARKGTSGDLTKALFGEDVQSRIMSGLSSGEGIIARVTDAVFRKEAVRGKDKKVVEYQEVLESPAAEDKRLIVLESEFGSVLQVMKRDGNNLNSVVRNAWDHGNLYVMTKMPRKATGAHISIIGHVTIPELKHLMLTTDLFNGFANRFLWLAVSRSKLLPEGGNMNVLPEFQARIRSTVFFAKEISIVRRDEDAVKLWKEYYHGELAQEYPGVLGAVVARSEGQVLRLSLIYALLDESPLIRVEHLRAAMAVWRYSVQSAKLIFGHATGNSLDDKILAAIRERPRKTTDIYRLDSNHSSKGDIQPALQRLVDAGLIRCETTKTGGRDAKLWHAAA